jgi:hypothetical protein
MSVCSGFVATVSISPVEENKPVEAFKFQENSMQKQTARNIFFMDFLDPIAGFSYPVYSINPYSCGNFQDTLL